MQKSQSDLIEMLEGILNSM